MAKKYQLTSYLTIKALNDLLKLVSIFWILFLASFVVKKKESFLKHFLAIVFAFNF